MSGWLKQMCWPSGWPKMSRCTQSASSPPARSLSSQVWESSAPVFIPRFREAVISCSSQSVPASSCRSEIRGLMRLSAYASAWGRQYARLSSVQYTFRFGFRG